MAIDEIPLTIPRLLAQNVESYGDSDVLVTGADTLTYRALDRRSAELARGLVAAGVGKASRVGVLMPNGAEWLVAVMAATRIGAIAIPLSTLYQARELSEVLNLVDADTLLCTDRYRSHDYRDRLESAFPRLGEMDTPDLCFAEAPYLRRVYIVGECDRPWARPLARLPVLAGEVSDRMLAEIEDRVTPSDVAVMVCTSGSTALPKAVMHTHGGLLRHTGIVSRHYWCFGEGDRISSIRPWFWVAGLSGTLFHVLHAGACLIPPASDAPEEILNLIRSSGLTGVSGTLPWFRRIAMYLEEHAPEFGLTPIAIDCAGVTRREGLDWRFISPNLNKLARPSDLPDDWRRFPSLYGMTETLGTHAGEPPPAFMPIDKIGASGRNTPDIIYRVVQLETGNDVAPGSVGELLVRGENVSVGLYKQERSETFDVNGFYRTGDLVTVDEQGCLTFVARRSEMIKVSGANVAPLEVEACLLSQTDVSEAAVVGLFQNTTDALLVAAVVPAAGATLDSEKILVTLKGLLSSYKVPRHIFVFSADDLPRTGTGKIKKPDLVPLLEAMASDLPGAARG